MKYTVLSGCIKSILFGVFIGFIISFSCESRPVLVELFTTRGNDECRTAEEAIQQLGEEYNSEEVQCLVYHIDDDLQINAGVARFRRFRKVPTVVFNGISYITGANIPGLYNSYRNKVENQLGLEPEGTIDGWMRCSEGRLITSVTMTFSLTNRPLNFVLALTQNQSETLLNIVRHVDPPVRVTDEITSVSKIVDIPAPIYDEGAEAIWFVQDRETNEILLSGSMNNRSPMLRDLTADGFINKWDIFYLSTYWGISNIEFDLYQDDEINVCDLLLFLGTE